MIDKSSNQKIILDDSRIDGQEIDSSTQKLIKENSNLSSDNINKKNFAGLHAKNNLAPVALASVDEPNYIDQFLDNKFFSKDIPDIFNYINIGGNAINALSVAFRASKKHQEVTTAIGSFSTKSFMLVNGAINFMERANRGNWLSAAGYLWDVLIPIIKIDHKHTYLARGLASGTYSLANALHNSDGNPNIKSFSKYIDHLKRSFTKFFKNLFSKEVIPNFVDNKKFMLGSFGGLLGASGTIAWLLTGQESLPTIARDAGSIIKDLEQVKFGHYKAGLSNYFYSGLTLIAGTTIDFIGKFVPTFRAMALPLTFMLDGYGRHLLRLHQNEFEKK